MTSEIKLSWNGGRVMQQLNTASKRGLEKVGKLIVDEMKRMILEEPKTGRMYGNHQASAPGEAPASDTGELVKSLAFNVENVKNNPALVVSARADHAIHLEYGTKFMQARPFMRPAVINLRRRIEMTVALELQKTLNQK